MLDKFSRFYLDIGKEISRHNGQIRIYSIHISGFLYPLIRLKFSSWISLKTWISAIGKRKYYKKIIKSNLEYKGFKIEDFINFHTSISKNISKEDLLIQALSYIDTIDLIFSKYQPSQILCIGDTRMCIQIAIALAKRNNIEVKYIEQGPFNRTFYDVKGANANLSIREAIGLTEESQNTITKNSSKKYLRSPLYRLTDILLKTIFEKTFIYPPDLKYTDVNIFRYRKKDSTIKISEGYRILLICQIPTDVNSLLHSPHFKSQTEILINVFQSLPPNSYLIVREHPLFSGKYESEFYDFIAKHSIEIENGTSLNKALLNSKIVVVNNSTVGFEAICQYKPTVVLGNAFYDNEKLCLKLKDRSELKSLLEQSLSYIPHNENIDLFKNQLFNSILLEGGISDRKLISSQTIAKDLIKAS